MASSMESNILGFKAIAFTVPEITTISNLNPTDEDVIAISDKISQSLTPLAQTSCLCVA